MGALEPGGRFNAELERHSFGAHGLKGNSFGGLRIKDVRVADWQMICADGEADDIFVDHFRYWRLMQVAAAIGTAERALELMVDRLIEREAYGAPIGRLSHLQQAVGQDTTELRMAKVLACEAAAMLDEEKGEAAYASRPMSRWRSKLAVLRSPAFDICWNFDCRHE